MPLPAALETEIRASFASQGALASIGCRMESLDAGLCTLVLDWSERVTQQHGFIHGGIVGAVADSAGGYAAQSLMSNDGERYLVQPLTVEYKLNILAPADGDRLIARGRVVKSGRTLTVSSADVFIVKAGAEKLCAVMQQTVFAMPNQNLKERSA